MRGGCSLDKVAESVEEISLPGDEGDGGALAARDDEGVALIKLL